MGNCLSSDKVETVKPPQATESAKENAKSKDNTPPPRTESNEIAMSARDEDGNERLAAKEDRATMEEDEYDYPSTLQEELNEMLEAIYSLVSEEQIQEYQQYLQDIEKVTILSYINSIFSIRRQHVSDLFAFGNSAV